MIVVIVADQDEIDGWKTLDDQSWICDCVHDEHPGPDGVEQDRIGDDVQARRLDECR